MGNTSQVKESQRPSKKQRPGTMMTKTMTMALCACLAAMLLASPALANRNLLGEMDDAMDAMNATMDAMNMTANATEMANDTITDAAEEMPASDDGRRMLLQLDGLQDSVTGVVDKAKDAASNAKDKATATLQAGVDKVNDFIGSAAGNVSALANETEGNMTMNGTEMADDEIEGEEMPEEMPASDDGRRKLLAGHEGHSDDDTMDMMNDTMMNMTMNATEMANDTMMNMTMNGTDDMANDTIAEDPEEMPSTDDG